MSREEGTKTTTNLPGEPITYPSGAAEITTEIVTLEPEGQTAYHTHQVPSWVYVLVDKVELRVDGADPQRMDEGQVFIEPQDTPMRAFNVAEGPTRLLVVSIGAEGQPTGQPAMPVSEQLTPAPTPSGPPPGCTPPRPSSHATSETMERSHA